jgi:hypothetical protein
MSRLSTSTGAEFASGESPCFLQPAALGDRLTRLFVFVRIGDAETTAVLDTGGAFLVLDPKFATSIGVGHRDAIARDRIHIRGLVQRGTIHRLPMTLLAAKGHHLTFEATAFVPELDHGETWPLPSYLGWQGCLDRIRFAIDPVEELVYFGATGG